MPTATPSISSFSASQPNFCFFLWYNHRISVVIRIFIQFSTKFYVLVAFLGWPRRRQYVKSIFQSPTNLGILFYVTRKFLMSSLNSQMSLQKIKSLKKLWIFKGNKWQSNLHQLIFPFFCIWFTLSRLQGRLGSKCLYKKKRIWKIVKNSATVF